MKPSISVITPAHDCAKYLPECVQSVALQKNVAVEHIIVDDASNDDTRRIMKELGEAHSHLRLEFLDSNIGQARARNFALSRAEGHYIFFLDADDMLEGQDALSELLESAQSNDADLVHFQYNRMPESETRITHAQNALTGERRAGVTLFSYPKLLNNTSCWQMLYRRRFLREQNLLFSHTLRQREDRPFFLECLLKARCVNVVQTRALRYRVRSDSTMRRLDLEQLVMFNEHLRITSQLMTDLADDETADVLRRAHLLYYMHVTLSYWAPFLMREDVRDTPEAAAYVAAFADPGWKTSDLFVDRIMENVPLRFRDTGMFDLLAHFLSTGQKEAAFDLIQNRQMTPDRLETLASTYRQGRSEDGFILTPEALGQFSSNVRLRPLSATSPRASRSKPRLVLHVGATKTGSSTLQKFLEINRFSLLHDHRVYFPMTGLENGRGPRGLRTSGHATLVANLINGRPSILNQLDQELDQLTQAPETIILSAENILSSRFWERGNVTGRLAQYLNEDRFSKVTIVGYLRNPIDWLESMYGESIASPGLRLDQTPEAFARDQESERLLDFDYIGGAFQGGMPYAELVFRSYDTLRALKRDVVQEFFEAIDLGHIRVDEYHKPGKRFSNPSISKAALRVIRSCNSIPMEREPAARLNASIIERTNVKVSEDARFYYGKAVETIKSRYLEKAVHFLAYHQPDFQATHLDVEDGRRNIEELPIAFYGSDLDSITKAITKAQAWRAEVEDVTVDRPEELDLRVADLFHAFVESLPTKTRNKDDMSSKIAAAKEILASGLFDGFYYLEQCPEALQYPGGPLMHYFETCRSLLLNPNRNFSTRDYLIINTDVAGSNMNPFHHFVAFGQKEGRQFIVT